MALGETAVKEAIAGAKDVIDHFFMRFVEIVQRIGKALAKALAGI